MKQFLRLFLAAGVIAFAVTMSATSCGKAADPNNNNNTTANNGNNNSGGSGGSGDGNKYKRPIPIADAGDIKITNVDNNVAKVNNTTTIPTILIRANGLTRALGTYGTAFANALTSTSVTKVFEITNEKASEGIVLVGKGNVPSADKITTGAPVTTYPTDDTGDDGIHVLRAATDHGAGKIFSGLNFFSVFANLTAQTDSDKNTEPFAFSTSSYVVSGRTFQSRLVFWCGAAASLAAPSTVAATDKLTGGHKAICYVAMSGSNFGNLDARNAWFAATAPFKREIQVAIAAIRTDGWTIGDLLSDGTSAADVAAFNDGISAAEMKRITESNSNPVPFKKFNIKIVQDADF